MGGDSQEGRPGGVPWSRRRFVGAAFAASGTLALAGCGRKAGSGPRPLRIGYVTPATGPLAPFSAADDYVLAGVRAALAQGILRGGVRHPVEILAQDSQSNPNRAAEVTSRLIDADVDLVLAASTADTVNPVADLCEAGEVPCLTTDTPWQAWFFGRSGDPRRGFDWTYHFCWGVDQLFQVYLDLWDRLETNKVVGALWPNDAEGNAFSAPRTGFAAAMQARGYRVVDTGRFQPSTDDFSAQIRAFKEAGAQLLTGVLTPPAFQTFWTQAAQQDFRPRIATVAKALLFPAVAASMGTRGHGLTTEVWWSPHHPFRSSLGGMTAAQYSADYGRASGRSWTQPMGFRHALFEVAANAFARAASIDDPRAIRDAIAATAMDTLVGRVDFPHGPVPNIATTPLVGGQWQGSANGGIELQVVDDTRAPAIPVTAPLQVLPDAR